MVSDTNFLLLLSDRLFSVFSLLSEKANSYHLPNKLLSHFMKSSILPITLLLGLTSIIGAEDKGLSKELPSDNYFEVETIIPTLNDPMQIAIDYKERIFIAERTGAVKLHDPAVGTPVTIHQLPTHHKERRIEPIYTYRGGGECGLLGMALDPEFEKNNYVYFYYSPIEKDCNRLSRFTFKENRLVDEINVLEVATERHAGPHHAGSIHFGNNRELFIAAGDNTNPHAADGYSPIDESAGGLNCDAQRSAGNSNDLRGAILRIVMNEDGSYDIPQGNLYRPGTPNTRPEIYAKGCRNPFRIFVDKKTGYLHWGEVGPDAREQSDRGPRGYDEYNIATEAGYFGWPYHVGVDYYNDYNYETKQSGVSFAKGIINDSPRNTGLKELPPVNAATVWYPYAKSEQFPELGDGGRNSMAGPVIYQDGLEHNFPAYFDGKPMWYDWVRARIMMITLDDNNKAVKLEPFLDSVKLSHPIDIKIGNQGDLYILNYGSAWYGNTDGQLIKVRYGGLNRRPVIKLAANKSVGAAPLDVIFSSQGTLDNDGDPMTYHWDFGNGASSNDANPAYSYTTPGIYTATLSVKDNQGKQNTASLKVIVGNERPSLSLKMAQDDGFFDWESELQYEVSGHDNEDGTLGTADIEVLAEYRPDRSIPPSKINTDANSTSDPRLEGMNLLLPGVKLIEQNHCLACHQSQLKSIGPSYKEVALRYPDTAKNRSYLLDKIKKGGNGVYGHIPMPAQAHIGDQHIKEIVTAILDMTGDPANISRSKSGMVKSIKRPAHPNDQKGIYVLRAQYTDKGANGLSALSAESEALILKAPVMVSGSKTQIDATIAKIDGGGAIVENDRHIGGYSDLNTTLSWKLIVETPGSYKISINQVVNIPQAGATYELQINGQSLSGTTKGSNGWHDYQDVALGELNLPKGNHILRLVPKTTPKGYVMNLRHIDLERIGILK